MLTTKNSGTIFFRALVACAWIIFCGCQPSGPKSLILGAKYIREGDYPRALRHLEKAAELIPAEPQVWNHLGLAWHGANQPAKAAEAYHRALRINPRLAAAHFNIGVLLLEQGRVNDAITALTTFVSLVPTNAVGFSQLGTALVQVRRMDEAERALTQALRLDPKDAEAHNHLAMVHVHRKRPREAMLELNAALQDRPGYAAALLNQAIIAQQYYGDHTLAMERYRAFLEITKTSPLASDIRTIVARLDEIERAKKEEIASLALPSKAAPPVPSVASAPEVPQVVATNVVAAAEPAPPKTNAVPQKKDPPRVVQPTVTNKPAVADVAGSATPSPATQSVAKAESEIPRAAARAPAITNQPAEPVQVVAVETDPELKAPTDVARPSNEIQTAMARTEERPLLAPRRPRDEDRSGLLDRATRWFRPDDKPVSRVATAPVAATATSRAVEEAPPVTKTVPPQFARYTYSNASYPKGNRTTAERLFVQGARAHQEQRLADAIQAYRQAVAEDPSYFDAQYNLGLAAYQMRDLPQALAANEAASKLKPQSADARYHFAISLREANYPVDAANELRELLAEWPNEVRAHLALANLYAQLLDEPRLAQQHYRTVLELAPNHSEAPAIRQWLSRR